MDKLQIVSALVYNVLDQLESWDSNNILTAILSPETKYGIQKPYIYKVTRAALTGNVDGANVAEIARVLGKEETLRRVATFYFAVEEVSCF